MEIDFFYFSSAALIGGWLLDRVLGDPVWLPHPVVFFGKWIAFFERKTNKGVHRKAIGAFWTVLSIISVYLLTALCLSGIVLLCGKWKPGIYVYAAVSVLLVFCGLAGTTLVREVRDVFRAADRSLNEGRRQVSRVVGRNTSELSDREVRTAALETLAENLSDGVVAPLFWLWLLGLPGMMAYKMVNTLDSMLGYRDERFKDFGCWAARIDDIANYIPARLTAMLMVLVVALPHKGTIARRSLKARCQFVLKNGRRHASPNSGYPEAALAAILDCRFGGPHHYGTLYVFKPYIGTNDRDLTTADLDCAVAVNRYVEAVVVLLCLFAFCS